MWMFHHVSLGGRFLPEFQWLSWKNDTQTVLASFERSLVENAANKRRTSHFLVFLSSPMMRVSCAAVLSIWYSQFALTLAFVTPNHSIKKPWGETQWFSPWLFAKAINVVANSDVYFHRNFQVPEPIKPLTVKQDLPTFLKSFLTFIVRPGTGAFVLGWKIDTFVAHKDDGKCTHSN